MFTCPNCGARVTGWKCEYCETVFPERKAEEDELSRLIRDYSKEIEGLTRKIAQDNLELEALCSDFNKSFGDIDNVVNWTVLFLIVSVAVTALLVFLS